MNYDNQTSLQWLDAFNREQEITLIDLNLRPQDLYLNTKGYALIVDYPFCNFRVDAPHLSGVYIWLVDGNPNYVGRAKSLRNRLSSQYGRVSPRHPYFGGQIQKCRINANLNNAISLGRKISVRWIVSENYISLEKSIIEDRKLPWNKL